MTFYEVVKNGRSTISLDLISQNGLSYLQSPPLVKMGFVEHAFMTRMGGTAGVAATDLDLSCNYQEKLSPLDVNWEKLAECFSLKPSDFVTLRQVHQDRILVLADVSEASDRENCRLAALAEGEEGYDAVVTNRPGLALAIRTADCVPLLLADPVKRVVGAVHAGWRGAALGLPAKTVDAFCALFGSNPADMIALLGPAIGPCCYQVDRVVFDAFPGDSLNKPFFRPQNREKWQLDLSRLIAAELAARGIKRDNIDCSFLCTSCCRDMFFSHRASGGESGRQLSFIRLNVHQSPSRPAPFDAVKSSQARRANHEE